MYLSMHLGRGVWIKGVCGQGVLDMGVDNEVCGLGSVFVNRLPFTSHTPPETATEVDTILLPGMPSCLRTFFTQSINH